MGFSLKHKGFHDAEIKIRSDSTSLQSSDDAPSAGRSMVVIAREQNSLVGFSLELEFNR